MATEFIPNHAARDQLLEALGESSIDALFAQIPEGVRSDGLVLPAAMAELDVVRHLSRILDRNQSTARAPSFVGGSLKEHHVPSFVGHLLSRQEFYTAYTPYQAELSQGTLQALFEFQSILSELTGLPVVNSSMYDWSTAIGEAALMARRVNRRSVVLVPQHMAPEKRSTLENYCRPVGMRVEAYDHDPDEGTSNLHAIENTLGQDTAMLYLENPNFFGVWEAQAGQAVAAAQAAGAVATVGFDLSSLGLVRGPGDLGADIAVGDGTTFCFPPSLGGPQLGLFATTQQLARRMPGRIIGATKDANGGLAYAMTLQTREQHIRRERATSNICTNQSLLAVGTAAHLSALGPRGLHELASANAEAGRRMARTLEAKTEWRRAFKGDHYNEATFRGPVDAETAYEDAGRMGVTPGYPVSRAVPELTNHLVACSTEIHTSEDHDRLAQVLAEVGA